MDEISQLVKSVNLELERIGETPLELPPGREPKARSNRWVFANLQDNVSKQVYDIGEAYRATLGLRRKRKDGSHRNGHPVQLLKYYYFLYLTGSRLREPLEEPAPTIEIINEGGLVHVEIHKVNLKHKAQDGQGHAVMEQAFPVFNEWEQKMWTYITDGGLAVRADEIFKFKEWKSTSKQNLNCLVKSNFRTNLRDTKGKVHRNAGITPHILRHMRAFNVTVNYGVEVPLAVKWFGWTDQRMLYYYAHIRERLNVRNQLDMLKRSGHLTNLAISIGKEIPY
jgi:hypothetical protein